MLRRAIVVLALEFALFSVAVAADRTLQEQLSDQYLDKILFLRHTFTSDSQEYDSRGKPKGHLQEGPWTFYGRLRIKKIALEADCLQLEGNRVVYKFDEAGRYLSPLSDPESVKVVIRLSNPIVSIDQAVSVLSRVFAMTEKEKLNSVPSYWRPYIANQPGTDDVKIDRAQDIGGSSTIANAGDERVFHLGESRVTAPKPQFTPGPEFPAQIGLSGVVGLNVIVDGTGRVNKVSIVHSLGKGLDEEAIRAVKNWRFKPATKDGVPVAVAVYIQVDFHTY